MANYVKQLLLLVVIGVYAAGYARATDDVVLISRGEVKVTRGDFFRLLNSSVPEDRRVSVLADQQKVRDMIADLFVIRYIAAEGRALKLDENEDFRFESALREDRMLTEAVLNDAIAKTKEPNFERIARERYTIDRAQFAQPEQVRVSHLLVKADEGRRKEEARARAEELRQRAIEKGSSFDNLAHEFSDDPSARNNNGDLGFFARGNMVKAFEDAAFNMSTPGQISEVVETQFGFHVIKFLERRPARTASFDEVKAQLISQEKAKFVGEMRKQKIEEVRSMDGIEVNQTAVSSISAK